VISLLKRSRPALPSPDLYVFGLVTDFRGYYPGYSARVRAAKDLFTWAILKGHTHNTAGRVAIRSADPRERPHVDFRCFDPACDPRGEDLEALVGAVELVRSITGRYRHLIAEEAHPGPEVTEPDEVRQWVRDEAWGHHASCTCPIGADGDPMAVLDGDFRVRGTEGLRVVDASVFPRIPGLFIVAAVYMVAEKASDVILAAARRQKNSPERGGR
jgi:choline dehydrogenase